MQRGGVLAERARRARPRSSARCEARVVLSRAVATAMDLRGKRCLITGGAAGLGAAAAHALAARGCAAITLLDLDVAAGEATARALLALRSSRVAG